MIMHKVLVPDGHKCITGLVALNGTKTLIRVSFYSQVCFVNIIIEYSPCHKKEVNDTKDIKY